MHLCKDFSFRVTSALLEKMGQIGKKHNLPERNFRQEWFKLEKSD